MVNSKYAKKSKLAAICRKKNGNSIAIITHIIIKVVISLAPSC